MLSKTTLLYAIGTAVALIVYFLIINAFGAADKHIYSAFNLVIMFIGMAAVMRSIFLRRGDDFRYMDGFLGGAAVGLIATGLLTAFLAVYTMEIDPDLATDFTDGWFSGFNVDTYEFLFATALMGFSTTIVFALVIIPIFKQSWNTYRQRKKQKPMNQKR